MKDYYRKDGKVNMCTAITELIADGREEGIREGKSLGIEAGENLLANLMRHLFADNRIADASLAANDEEARKQFYREYGLLDGQDE